MDPAVLNLSPEEKRVFGFLFDKADADQLGVVTGERAVSFFERTGVQPQVLGEIWQIADTENRGFLMKPGFCIVLRLIGHYQAGRTPSSELAFKSGPVPKFEGLQIPPAPAQSPTQSSFPPGVLQPQNSGQGIRIPPLDPQKVAQYSGLFERSGAQNGLLNGLTAKAIFERAGLPVETLGKIWTLADREQRGALDQTEFIVAMHLLTSTKSKAMTGLPNTLPQGFYDAAARRGAPPPPPQARQGTAQRQFTGSSIGAPVRTSSPLARPAAVGTPPPGPAWLVTPAEKAKYDQFFSNIDTQGLGVLSGEQAVAFFGDSGLPEDTLASIWDLADIKSEGQLNKDEFAVAMFLIKQQRTSGAAPLPAFLPPALIPPSMRKQNIQQQTQQTTAPAFETTTEPKTMPKSAADDLFGLDEPAQPAQQPLAPQTQKSVDPFASNSPSSRTSPARFQSASVFKPFMPTSAFGASLTSQNTGGSQSSAAPQPKAVSAMDDLLGDSETHTEESSKLNNDSTELANMSNQIGNLRTQMEDTQGKKSTAQAELNATQTQKRDLETRLQQFRAQYEQEVRTVKDLEQQLTQSRESTKKLDQELALLEGGYQDLQTQHQTLAQSLQADQTENANLKQRITQLNAEVARLKPEIEKMKLDGRQQKGMVSINKKQVTTNEAERDRLNSEKSQLEREAAESRVASPEPIVAPREPASRVVSPEPSRDTASPASVLSTTNPFFRKTDVPSASPAAIGSGTPTPSAFDQLFGPSFAQESTRSPPPPTTFANKSHIANVADSVSSDGKLTPAATPPPADTREPPPAEATKQSTSEQLPIGGLNAPQEDTASTSVRPPTSRAGDSEMGASTPAAITEDLPGAFPDDQKAESARTPEAESGTARSHSDLPPVRSLEIEQDDSDDSESDDEPSSVAQGKQPMLDRPATSTANSAASELPKISAQTSPPPYERTEGVERSDSDPNAFPKEFTGLLPSREDPTSPEPAQEEPTTPKAAHQPQISFGQTPISATTNAADVFHDASSRPMSVVADATDVQHGNAPKNAFDEFDEFDDLADAQEADKSGSDFDFGFGHSRGPSEFDAAFDTPVPASAQAKGPSTNGFHSENSPFASGQTASSSIQNTPETKHDWDAIFSGLDSSTAPETSFGSNDPWEPTSSASTKPTGKDVGGALTPGTEHDDPILKRLTSIGYKRSDALSALEQYDYDFEAAFAHLSTK